MNHGVEACPRHRNSGFQPLPQDEQDPEEQEEHPEDAELEWNFPLLLCANTLIFLATFAEEHFGQLIFSEELLTSSSNSAPHFLQTYS